MTDDGPSTADGNHDLIGWLRASPPFNALALDRVQEMARATRVERFAAGTTILRRRSGRGWLSGARPGSNRRSIPIRTTVGIEAAGIPRCNGDAMAITPGLRRSVESWATAFRDWMTDAGREGSIFSSITFDHRRVSGPLDIEPTLHAVIATAADRYPDFLRHLAHRALDRKPPTGFIRNFVVESKGEHTGRFDIKHGGVTIISNLARLYAIRTGRPERSTLDRLRAAEETGQINEEDRQALEEAFRLLWQIRLEHQGRQVRAATEPDDFVDPGELGPIARLGLKEAFRIIGNEQQGLATQIGARY